MNQPNTRSTPIDKLSRPFVKFLHIEAGGGIVLLVCTLIALFLANSPFAESYLEFWKIPVAFSIGSFQFTHSIGHWINDGLMTIFFFVVGLEIKREIVAGELKNRSAALLPMFGAIGGMAIPAILYVLSLGANEGIAGWGIPMATDIAFVVGFLSLFGKRVPHGLKIFILSLAIIDDLGAIIVIAVFYSSNISLAALGFGFLGLAFVTLLNRIGVRRIPVYVFFGIFIWFAFLASGVHPTIAGVLLGLLTPASAWIGDRALLDVLAALPASLKGKKDQVKHLISTATETVSPLERLEMSLHPWVAYFIMPVFALANAGVYLAVESMTAPISLAVALGLFVGKPLGILLFSWLAVSFLGARLPENVNWKAMLGVACLAGIGFTMSIFIAGLALDGSHLTEGKVGTMIGSVFSAFLGLGILHFALPRPQGKTN